MHKKVVIILFVITFEIWAGAIKDCYAASDERIGSFEEFLEVKVNPIIWYLHDKVVALINGHDGAGNSDIYRHRLLDLNSEFIENNDAGTLFVITGNVQFRHEQRLEEILLQGRIFALQQELIQSETVACGNLISMEKLGHMEIDQVKKRLQQLPDKKQMMKKGQTKPFMIVFSNFSKEKMEAFTIEIKEAPEQVNHGLKP